MLLQNPTSDTGGHRPSSARATDRDGARRQTSRHSPPQRSDRNNGAPNPSLQNGHVFAEAGGHVSGMARAVGLVESTVDSDQGLPENWALKTTTIVFREQSQKLLLEARDAAHELKAGIHTDIKPCILNGQWIMRDQKILNINEEEVISLAKHASGELLKSSGVTIPNRKNFIESFILSM